MADTVNLSQRLSHWWRNEFSIATFGTNLFAAFLIYLLEITFVISFTTLIFSGELISQIPQALGFIILGDAILVAFATLFSSSPGTMAVAQDTPGAILGIVAVAIVTTLSAEPAMQFATVVMMIMLTTTLTGALLLALGVFKLSKLVRFLPYPVMGGFLAGTGWLLATGGIGVMTNLPFGVQWLEEGILALWLPGVILALLIYFVTQKINKPFIIPTLLILATVIFFVIIGISHTPINRLQSDGWMFDTVSTGSLWQFPLRSSLISQVDWSLLLQQIPALLPVAVISVIALLLNTSGLELIIKKDIDLNRELIVAGVGNLVAGPLGGLVGYQSISLSTLSHYMSGGRLVGVLVALLVGATIFIGSSVLLYIPKFIFGSILFYLGFGLLVEWVHDAWFKFPRIDFLVIITILAIIVFWGFLEGVLIGLILAIGMFVVSYSQVSVIKFAFTGREYRSRVTRILQEQEILEKYGDQSYILKLAGFIFFGTAHNIFTQSREQIEARPTRDVKFIVMDFAQVSGVDSTGMLSFARMAQWSQENGIRLVLTGLTGRAQAQVLKEPILNQEEVVIFFPDLDHGLEWCENKIINTHQSSQPTKTEPVSLLTPILGEVGIKKLSPYWQRREYKPGDYLMKEGDASDFVYFLESGQVTAQLEVRGKPPVRLETMFGGRTVGELGFYLGTPRTACVVAEQASVVYMLSTVDLRRMERDDPEAAALFHHVMVLLLSERVAHLTRTVGALEHS